MNDKVNKIQIPEDWEENNFGALIIEKPKSQLKVSDATGFGNYPFFTSGEAILVHHKKQIDGENLFLATGGVANVKYHNGEVAYSTDTYALTSDNTNLKYLYYFLLNNLYYVNSNYFLGSGLKHLQKKDLKNHSFLLPKSTTEQKKIAEILSKVDTAIEQTQSLIAKYQRIKTGLMQDLLTKGIDENGNIRSEETHEFKDSELGRIPKGWEVEKLGKLILAVDPQPDHRTPPVSLDGVPYVGISDVKNGEIDFDNSRKVGFNVLEKQMNSFTINQGDIIFGKIGTIGKPTILPEFDKKRYTLSANVILIKPYECASFIFFTLTSEYILNQIKLAIHSTSQPAFGMEKIRNLEILTPTPEERLRISTKLKSLNNLFDAEETKLQKLQSLKTGLMQDLLSGKKRVTNLIKEKAL